MKLAGSVLANAAIHPLRVSDDVLDSQVACRLPDSKFMIAGPGYLRIDDNSPSGLFDPTVKDLTFNDLPLNPRL